MRSQSPPVDDQARYQHERHAHQHHYHLPHTNPSGNFQYHQFQDEHGDQWIDGSQAFAWAPWQEDARQHMQEQDVGKTRRSGLTSIVSEEQLGCQIRAVGDDANLQDEPVGSAQRLLARLQLGAYCRKGASSHCQHQDRAQDVERQILRCVFAQ